MKAQLITYFISNGRVDLPNIGSLNLVIEPASITLTSIEPPQYTISFSTDSSNAAPAQLQYLSNELDKSIEQVKLELIDLASDIKKEGLFVFGNFGVLKYINEEFIFENFFTDADYQLPIEIILEDASSTTQITKMRNNNWIWWALGLSAIALLAIYLK